MKGRVVYARKKHEMSTTDLIRIGKKTGVVFYSVAADQIREFLTKLEEAADALPFIRAWQIGGGGSTFGGGGASRYFPYLSSSRALNDVQQGVCFLIDDSTEV